ncbi:MAG TPA: chorismate-binding protein [candidate division Zixibacteria bacterium]
MRNTAEIRNPNESGLTIADGTSELTTPASPHPHASAMHVRAAQCALEHAIRDRRPTLLSASGPCNQDDMIEWLARYSAVPSVYFRTREGVEYAGIGAAWEMRIADSFSTKDLIDSAQSILKSRSYSDGEGALPAFIGGMPFDRESDDPQWRGAGFGAVRLFVPEALRIRDQSGSFLIASTEVRPTDTIHDILSRLDVVLAGYAPPTSPGRLESHSRWTIVADDSRDDWDRGVWHALSHISTNRVSKVVLSRHVRLRCDGRPDRWEVLERLRRFDDSCFTFLFDFGLGASFVGASPEQLFKLEEDRLAVDCIAGTMSPPTGYGDDEQIERLMLADEKICREHEHVAGLLRDDISALCLEDAPSVEPRIMRLRTLRHLRSIQRGRLRPGTSLGDVITRLHPSAAVGGRPRPEALELIRSLEPHARGWYAGPVGYVSADRAEFAVAIRSALVDKDGAWAYAGAGIVAGSDPEAEWSETAHKLQAFLRAVNASADPH